jgi:hypothetical protein
MSEPTYQPISDLIMDGKEYSYVFTDEDGNQKPITMYRVFENKMIVEMFTNPKNVIPLKPPKKKKKE